MATQQTTGQQPQRALSGTTYATEEAMEGPWMDFEEGTHGGTAIAAEVAQNERTVHTKFFNDFDELFNDEDLD